MELLVPGYCLPSTGTICSSSDKILAKTLFFCVERPWGFGCHVSNSRLPFMFPQTQQTRNPLVTCPLPLPQDPGDREGEGPDQTLDQVEECTIGILGPPALQFNVLWLPPYGMPYVRSDRFTCFSYSTECARQNCLVELFNKGIKSIVQWNSSGRNIYKRTGL